MCCTYVPDGIRWINVTKGNDEAREMGAFITATIAAKWDQMFLQIVLRTNGHA